MALFSIIIPIFKSNPDYLRIALKSCTNQSFGGFEVILDDCSCFFEGNPHFLDAFDQRFIVNAHKDNRGLSASRNDGVKASSGRYIVFLDDDDALSPVFLERALPYLDDDAIVCYPDTSDEVGLSGAIPENENVIVFENEEIVDFFSRYDSKKPMPFVDEHSSWSKIYPASLFKAKGKWFDENQGFVGEDTLFHWSCIGSYKRLMCFNRCPMYFYRQRSLSLSKGYREGVTEKFIALANKLASISKGNARLLNQLFFEICNVYVYCIFKQEIFNKAWKCKRRERVRLLRLMLNDPLFSKAFSSEPSKLVRSKAKRTVVRLLQKRRINLLCLLGYLKY